jgi:hypothetical protein
MTPSPPLFGSFLFARFPTGADGFFLSLTAAFPLPGLTKVSRTACDFLAGDRMPTVTRIPAGGAAHTRRSFFPPGFEAGCLYLAPGMADPGVLLRFTTPPESCWAVLQHGMAPASTCRSTLAGAARTSWPTVLHAT